MEKLKHEFICACLDQRADRIVTESAVGFMHHAAEIRMRNFAIDKRSEHRQRNIHIGFSAQFADLFQRKLGVILRQIETAIPGKAGEQCIAEPQDWRFPTRAYIFHFLGLHFRSTRF